jgi:putative nucleotidyltransferase with HDIG domain
MKPGPSRFQEDGTQAATRDRISGTAERPIRDNLMPVTYDERSQLNREESWELMCAWTESESLRKHMLAVEAAMRAYARRFGEDEEKWGITGLLHDMDYERHPTPEEHPMVGVRELERRGYPDDVIHAIKGHADYLDVPRDTLMSRTLYAVDELSGFIVACALMRPEGLENMKAKSVRKKMKQKSFAAAVNREDIVRGAEELGVDLDEHIVFVAGALREHSDELGFTPREA